MVGLEIFPQQPAESTESDTELTPQQLRQLVRDTRRAAGRTRQKLWDRENMVVLACKVPRHTALAWYAALLHNPRRGNNTNDALKTYVQRVVASDQKAAPPPGKKH